VVAVPDGLDSEVDEVEGPNRLQDGEGDHGLREQSPDAGGDG
jgi:hypothetical protein